MKKIIIILVLALLAIGCGRTTKPNPNEFVGVDTTKSDNKDYETTKEPKPYEATWLELAKTDKGYIVYNYSNPWNEDGYGIAPMHIAVRNDSLIWSTCYEPAARLSLKKINVEKRKDGSFFFPIGNEFLFTWYDKEKHIAQWTIYFGDKPPLSSHLYIDSRYNTFPVLEYDWDKNPMRK